jgi:hypothetical protein
MDFSIPFIDHGAEALIFLLIQEVGIAEEKSILTSHWQQKRVGRWTSHDLPGVPGGATA